MLYVVCMIITSVVCDLFKKKINSFKGACVIGGMYVIFNIGAYYLLTGVFGMRETLWTIFAMSAVIYYILVPLTIWAYMKIKY